MRSLIGRALAAASFSILAAGCNTVRGMGEDVESVAVAFDPAASYHVCGSYGPIDSNGDGRISNAEWAAYHAGAYRGWDLNGDGRISRREYAQCWYGGGFYTNYHKQMYEPSWTAFDANGDGWISPDEYYGTTAWDRLDLNHDGVIDASEWPW